MRQSADTTDLIGPFDIHQYTPIYGSISSYDSVLYHRAGEVMVSISNIQKETLWEADTIIINRKLLADFLKLDLDSTLSCYSIPSIFPGNVSNDSITLHLGIYQFDSDVGYGIGYLWTASGDSFFEDPDIREE